MPFAYSDTYWVIPEGVTVTNFLCTHQQVDFAPDEDGPRVVAVVVGLVLRHREPAQSVARVVKVPRLAGLVHEAATRILRFKDGARLRDLEMCYNTQPHR